MRPSCLYFHSLPGPLVLLLYGKRLIDERVLKSYTPRAYRGQRLREKATNDRRDGHVS